ncbi:MAG: di-trans,poly-cis-decaprenylcistransferase [Deltaproteobacteria bacterium RBG_16_71_12]|nr:MAG: di-trans,poly-cis-decaprenylcistransferase [Deltaproteobacteria bacterium RBG_16_71_12]
MSAAPVPRHVAIIMDGNGRWAEERGLPRLEGHRAGAKAVRDITTYCRELGVRYLTLYAFSSENWGRPETEVAGLMQLLQDYLKDERTTLLKNQIELCTIGAVDKLPLVVRALLGAVKEATRGLSGMRLTLALSYGARDEIVRAVRAVAADVKRGALAIDDIGPEHIEAHLDSAGTPDPDLLLRTSGEMRVSNFMLWQIAYSELYVTPVAWPDFSRARLDEAFASYRGRQRRFGLTGAQVAPGGGARGGA